VEVNILFYKPNNSKNQKQFQHYHVNDLN